MVDSSPPRGRLMRGGGGATLGLMASPGLFGEIRNGAGSAPSGALDGTVRVRFNLPNMTTLE